MIFKVSSVVVLALVALPSTSYGSPFSLFSDWDGLSPRQGRNSKLMTFAQDPTTASPLTIKTNGNPSTYIEDVVSNIQQAFAGNPVPEENLGELENAVTDMVMNEVIKDIIGGQDSIRDQFQRRPAVPQRQFNRPAETYGYEAQPQLTNRGQYGNPRADNGISADFGPNMGADAFVDPENNVYSRTPQLDQEELGFRQGQEVSTENPTTESDLTALPGSVDSGSGSDDEVRCVNKVMQVEETVYEERIKCQHTFQEKCHDTFITDYVPSQEKKCETSFKKNCHIYYKPMMFEENVEICEEPLKKVCNDDIVGEDICKTHYETVCETRYREHEVEQDEPVCEMVTERRCNGVTVPLPDSSNSTEFRYKRQAVDDDSGNGLNANLGFLQNNEFVNVGADCEEWPVQKCTLEKRTVKKVNPETSCEKVPKDICAPSNCEIRKADKACRTETRNLIQNIPSEQCDLEPQESCKMETVLVPRLVQQPNCIKVPKEVCVNAKTNPKKMKKPVIKEWCYRPSDLKSPTSRLALSQFFRN